MASIGLSTIRTRSVWLLVIPFFWLAAPSAASLAVGVVLAVVGLWMRGWAAGMIHKNQRLSTTGPYAHTRNPLYLGSLLIGVGVCVAGAQWPFLAIFLVFFLWIYGRTMEKEAAFLEERFGDAFVAYRDAVPRLWPRLRPYRAPDADSPPRFDLDRYRDNREWEAALGAAAAFGLLAAKMVFA